MVFAERQWRDDRHDGSRSRLEGPVRSPTPSVGVVRDAVIQVAHRGHGAADLSGIGGFPPVVARPDGELNDQRLPQTGRRFPCPERRFHWSCSRGQRWRRHWNDLQRLQDGTGTASRLSTKDGAYTVGVLVQCNYGVQRAARCGLRWDELPQNSAQRRHGSIIVVVATTSALPSQLKRLARRVPLGLGHGQLPGDSRATSLCFSTANWSVGEGKVKQIAMVRTTT